MTNNNNILIAQGGGPTNVINQSLVSIIESEVKTNRKVYGSINGVNGIINNNFKLLNKISSKDLELIKNTPGAALGSTRDKPDEDYCKKIYEILKKKRICKFYYIGGNDSSDSLKIISKYSREKKYNLQCIHIPKTIDNDLVLNDHTPGFGSAAKYVAQLFSGINYDVKSLPGVYIGVVMGRHAGFLTASSALLRDNNTDGPHLIFIPEFEFNLKSFVDSIKSNFKKYGRCIIAVSEGIQNKNGKLLTETIKQLNEYDDHGNIQLSGSGILGDYLASVVKDKLKVSRVRADTLGYSQRSFLGSESEVDQKEAFEIGRAAVKFSYTSPDSFSIGIKERKSFNQKYITKFIVNKLEDIAGKTKVMPLSFYDNKRFNVTKEFIDYCKPLIGKNFPKTTSII